MVDLPLGVRLSIVAVGLSVGVCLGVGVLVFGGGGRGTFGFLERL